MRFTDFYVAALYNLRNDVGEAKNVIDEYPEIAERMAEALDDHIRRIGMN